MEMKFVAPRDPFTGGQSQLSTVMPGFEGQFTSLLLASSSDEETDLLYEEVSEYIGLVTSVIIIFICIPTFIRVGGCNCDKNQSYRFLKWNIFYLMMVSLFNGVYSATQLGLLPLKQRTCNFDTPDGIATYVIISTMLTIAYSFMGIIIWTVAFKYWVISRQFVRVSRYIKMQQEQTDDSNHSGGRRIVDIGKGIKYQSLKYDRYEIIGNIIIVVNNGIYSFCLQANVGCLAEKSQTLKLIEFVMLVLMGVRLFSCDLLLINAVNTIREASKEFSDMPNTKTFRLHFALTTILFLTFIAQYGILVVINQRWWPITFAHPGRYTQLANGIGFSGQFIAMIILLYLFWGYGIRKPDERDYAQTKRRTTKKKQCKVSKVLTGDNATKLLSMKQCDSEESQDQPDSLISNDVDQSKYTLNGEEGRESHYGQTREQSDTIGEETYDRESGGSFDQQIEHDEFVEEDDEEMNMEERQLQQAILRNFFEARRHDSSWTKPAQVFTEEDCDESEVENHRSRIQVSLLQASEEGK